MATEQQADKKKTLDDLLNIEDEKEKKTELIDGEMIMMAPASALHSAAQANLITEISRSLNEDGSPKVPHDYILLCEAWTYYDQYNSFVHDLAAFDKGKIKKIPEKGPMRITPFWVCEILSPSNWIDDTQKKRLKLEEAGVPYYWIINPREKNLMVFELKKRGDHYQLLVSASSEMQPKELPPFGGVKIKKIF